MATAILRSGDIFPVGTSVEAFPATNWPIHERPPAGAPAGDSEGSGATVGQDSAVSFDGLQEHAEYYAYARVAGRDRYVRFTTRGA